MIYIIPLREIEAKTNIKAGKKLIGESSTIFILL